MKTDLTPEQQAMIGNAPTLRETLAEVDGQLAAVVPHVKALESQKASLESQLAEIDKLLSQGPTKEEKPKRKRSMGEP